MALRGIVGYAAAQFQDPVETRAVATFGGRDEISLPIDTLLPPNMKNKENIPTITAIVDTINRAFRAHDFVEDDAGLSGQSYAQVASVDAIGGRYVQLATNNIHQLAKAFPHIIETARLYANEVDKKGRSDGWHI